MKAYLEIEMPKSCYYCPLTNDGYYLCKATSPFKELEDDCEECRPEWCPIVPVPEHGDLIDRDSLMDSDGDLRDGMWGWSGVQIANAPAIIPTEEGGI